MSRSITVQPKNDLLPWRAQPGPETTMSELEAAICYLKLDILRTTDDEILLVQTAEAIKDGVPPPDIEELAMVMFVDKAGEAILVEETGTFEVLPDLKAVGEIDFGSAEEFSMPADLHAEGKIDAFDQEAKDRHFEEDADREMIGDDVNLGVTNIGNK